MSSSRDQSRRGIRSQALQKDSTTLPAKARHLSRDSAVSRGAASERSPRRKPWVMTKMTHQPRRGERKLIPQIFLVVSHVVLLKELQELVLKRMPLMMFFLARNVFCQGCDLRFANAEYSVPGLPSKGRIPFLANPSRRVGFDHASDFRSGLGRANSN